MTRRQAIMILIDHASRNAKGGGLGYHVIPSDDELNKLSQAVVKVWPAAYPLDSSVWFNLGLKPPA